MLSVALGVAAGAERGGAPLLLGRAVRDWKVAADQTVPDLTGRGTALTLNGGPTFVAASGSVPAHYTLNGSSQWLAAINHADLNFAAGEPLTLIAIVRAANMSGTTAATFAAKKANNTTGAGYAIFKSATANRITCQLADGTNAPAATVDKTLQNNLVLPLAIRRTPGTGIQAYFNGTWGSNVADTSGSLSNSEELRFGRLSGAGTSYQTMHFFRALLFRAALSDAEFAAILPELVR